MLLPLQGAYTRYLDTQGDALGYGLFGPSGRIYTAMGFLAESTQQRAFWPSPHGYGLFGRIHTAAGFLAESTRQRAFWPSPHGSRHFGRIHTAAGFQAESTRQQAFWPNPHGSRLLALQAESTQQQAGLSGRWLFGFFAFLHSCWFFGLSTPLFHEFANLN